VLAERALERAKKLLARPGGLYLAALLLEWGVARCEGVEAAERLSELLAQLRNDPEQNRQLLRQGEAQSRAWLRARAKALENLGELAAARLAWDGLARLADGDERKKAQDEVSRLAGLLARTPYLGLTFAGDSTTVKEVVAGGPAHKAGLRPGDVVEALGKVRVSSLAELRLLVRKLRPGETVALSLRRTDESVKVDLTVGSGGEKDPTGANPPRRVPK
jgi:C-terminal processing protease CtpA/Prc